MELTYTLTEADYLNHQLYLASQSKRIRKTRLRSRILVFGAFLAFASLFYTRHDAALTWYFLVLAVVVLLFYPIYQRWFYKRHYQRYIAESYRAKAGKPTTLRLEHDKLWSKDELTEGSIDLAALEEIVEVPTAFYLRLVTSTSLLLPKQSLLHPDEVRSALQATARRCSVPFRQELDWRWR